MNTPFPRRAIVIIVGAVVAGIAGLLVSTAGVAGDLGARRQAERRSDDTIQCVVNLLLVPSEQRPKLPQSEIRRLCPALVDVLKRRQPIPVTTAPTTTTTTTTTVGRRSSTTTQPSARPTPTSAPQAAPAAPTTTAPHSTTTTRPSLVCAIGHCIGEIP